MSAMKIVRMLPLVAALAVAACGGDSSAPRNSGQVRAFARDEQNSGVGGIVMRLSQGNYSITRTTTVSGNAVFDDVGPGDWQLEATVPTDYKLASSQASPVTFNLRDGQVKDVSVSLVKQVLEKPPGGGGEPAPKE